MHGNDFSFEMMQERNSMIFTEVELSTIHQATVLVAGVGGVGGFAIEVLVRMGVREIIIIDGDVVQMSNFNRQIISNVGSVGQMKVEAMASRALTINPKLIITPINEILHKENIAAILDRYRVDLILDAIDSVGSKAQLIAYAKSRDISIVTALGAAQRRDPTQLQVIDLFKTYQDPLARALRNALRKLEIKESVLAVFNTELPIKRESDVASQDGSKTLGSYIAVVMVAGSLLADAGIKLLLKKDKSYAK